jgi:hypothetical protein
METEVELPGFLSSIRQSNGRDIAGSLRMGMALV